MKDYAAGSMAEKRAADKEAMRGGENELEGSRQAQEAQRMMERMDKKAQGRPARKMRR
jgi:hypothetical protein